MKNPLQILLGSAVLYLGLAMAHGCSDPRPLDPVPDASAQSAGGAGPGGEPLVSCGKGNTVKIEMAGKDFGALTGLRIFGRAKDVTGTFGKWRGPMQYVLEDAGGSITADCPGQQGFGAEVVVLQP